MKLMFLARVRRRAPSRGKQKCGGFLKHFSMQKNMLKTDRTYSLKKADIDSVEISLWFI